MNITEFKIKPKIIEVEIDDKAIIETYGDTIKFYMYDHMDITTYFKFFRAQSEGNTDELLKIVKKVILDEKGKQVMTDEYELPVDIFTNAVIKITDHLGKSATKNSIPTETGTQQ
jgi:hypothetical protein